MVIPHSPLRCIVGLTVLIAAVASAHARSNREPRWDAVAEGRVAGAPVLVVVALKEQRITIYDGNGPILRAPISSGRTDYETPVGVFSVLQKEAEHYSNRYDDASMPFMERITWSGIALHAGALPGSPASHGCIRLPYEFAEKLFGLTKLGLRVVIARSDIAPIAISHPNLLKPNFTVSDVRFLVPTSDQPVTPTSVANDESLALPPEVASQLKAFRSVAETEKTKADAASQDADKAKLASQRLVPAKEQALKALRDAEKVASRAEQQVAEAVRDTSVYGFTNSHAASGRSEGKSRNELERFKPTTRNHPDQSAADHRCCGWCHRCRDCGRVSEDGLDGGFPGSEAQTVAGLHLRQSEDATTLCAPGI